MERLFSHAEIMEGSTPMSASFHNTSVSLTSKILTSTSSVLSMVGAAIIIGTYFAWKDIRTSSRAILVYISIADFFTAFGNMFSTLESTVHDTLCVSQSFVTTTSSLWSFFWTTFLAIYLYCSVVLRKPLLAERMLLVFHVFAWGVPVVITSLALGFDALGDDKDRYSAGWCWISSKSEHRVMWMLITGKGWEIATYILIVGFYASLKCYIHKDVKYKHEQFSTDSARHAAVRVERKLTFVPLVFILVRIWGTLRFLMSFSTSDQIQQWMDYLLYLQGIGDSSQGFANFMLFLFFTEKFQRKIRQTCCKCKRSIPNSVQESTGTANISQRNGVHPARRKTEKSPLLSKMEGENNQSLERDNYS